MSIMFRGYTIRMESRTGALCRLKRLCRPYGAGGSRDGERGTTRSFYSAVFCFGERPGTAAFCSRIFRENGRSS
jgi:hypothetical protein